MHALHSSVAAWIDGIVFVWPCLSKWEEIAITMGCGVMEFFAFNYGGCSDSLCDSYLISMPRIGRPRFVESALQHKNVRLVATSNEGCSGTSSIVPLAAPLPRVGAEHDKCGDVGAAALQKLRRG